MTRLRVATFNLLHGMSLSSGAASPEDLASAARQLDADVVGLQEVDYGQARSGSVDQTALVAQSLGAPHHVFVPALHGTPGTSRTWTPAGETATDGPSYGVGLVSRLPVLHTRVRRFPAAPVSLPLLVPASPRPRLMRIPDEPRVAVLAVVQGPAGPLSVVTAHLSFVPGVNVRQLRALSRWARDFPSPRLLIGDFNLPGALPARITGWRQLARAATYPAGRPRVQLDHVLGDGVGRDAVRDVEVLTLPVSDHCGLVVDLDL